MKVITRCIINMQTLQVIDEKYYYYVGPIAKCKGGGGSSSGKVDYPEFMKTWLGNALNDSGVDTLTTSMTASMEAAAGNSPWTTKAAYNPDTDIVNLVAAPSILQTMVTLLSSGTTLDTLIASILDNSRIDAEIVAFAADMDARLLSEVLPRFEAGMLDINAVQSSAFVIGRALIEENNDRQVAKYAADVRNKAFSDDAIKVIGMKFEYQKAVSQMLAESYRIKIVAKKEQIERDDEIDKFDALWDLETFQYGANLLASIGSGTVIPGKQGPSGIGSAIGGALSGAAAGAYITETAMGAGIGGILGLASGFI